MDEEIAYGRLRDAFDEIASFCDDILNELSKYKSVTEERIILGQLIDLGGDGYGCDDRPCES